MRCVGNAEQVAFSIHFNITLFLFVNLFWLNFERLTVWVTEDPWTEALCSLAGKGLCRDWGTQWMCVLYLHTGDQAWTHYYLFPVSRVYFTWGVPLYVPFEPQHTWPSRGCPAPPRAPWRSRLLALWLSVSAVALGSVGEIQEHNNNVCVWRRLLEALQWLRTEYLPTLLWSYVT